MSWPLTTLDQIFEIARGGSPRPIDQFITDADDGVNWISISDASNSSKYIRHTKKKIKPSGVSRSRLVKPGDFLLTNSMSFGRPYILDTHGCIHDGWLVLSPRIANVDQDYFYHLLGSPSIFGQFEKLAAGATVKNLNIDLVRSVVVGLPPLGEQKRIAAILDQADELRRKRQRAIDRLNQLGQAIFYEMFGDPLGAPSAEVEWTTESLESNVEFMDYRGKTPLKAESGIRLITARNVKMGFINLEPQEFVEVESYNSWMTRGFPKKGDVLFTTEAPLGHVAQLDTDETVVIGQRLITMKPNRNLIRPTYLEFFLRTPSFRRKMFENSTGSTVVGIKSKLLKKIDIRYPAGQFQDNFDAAIHQLRATAPHFSRSVVDIEALFVSLQHRAFQGEL